MFITYIDSSGRPYGDKENYVLASLITNEAVWQTIDNSVKQIKLKYFSNLPDEDIEIHAKDMMNHDKVFQHLSWDQIYAILDEVFNLISDNDTQLSIIAVLIDKVKLKKSIDIETWAYRLLFERINRFIERQAESLIEEEHPPQYGIMIMDSEGMTKDQKLRKRLVSILRNGTLYSQLNYLIEDPLFTDSKWRNLSQLADCVAYCIRKKYRNNSSSFHTDKWQSYYNKIESKFDCPFGSYERYGLKIFP